MLHEVRTLIKLKSKDDDDNDDHTTMMMVTIIVMLMTAIEMMMMIIIVLMTTTMMIMMMMVMMMTTNTIKTMTLMVSGDDGFIFSLHRHYLGPEVDVETVWLLSIFIGLWTTGLTLGALVQKYFPRPRLMALVGILVFDGAFAATAWTVKHSMVLYITSFGALTGLADGFVYTACIAFIPMWEKRRVGLATALSTSGLGVGAVVINQVISRYVNPENKIADRPDGNIMLFSQEEISERVPNLFLLLAVFNLFFHILGVLLLKTKSDDKVADNEQDAESQKHPLTQNTKLVDINKETELAVRLEKAGILNAGKHFSEESKMFRPRVWSLNNERVPSTKESFRINKGSPWDSAENLSAEWQKMPGWCQCRCVCQPPTVLGNRTNTVLPGILIGSPMHSSECSGRLCESRDCSNHRLKLHQHMLASSDRNELRKDQVTNAAPASFRLGSNTIRSGYQKHCNRCYALNNNSTIAYNVNANFFSCEHHQNYKNSIEFANDKTATTTTKPLQYGSTKATHLAEDQNKSGKDPEKGSFKVEKEYSKASSTEVRSFTPREMVCSKMFFVLWVTQFSMDYSLSVLTNYYKLYGELHIKDDYFLACLGTAMTASIIIPKLGWGWLLDIWGLKFTLACMASSTVIISSFWYFTAMINRYLYSLLTLGLCWCVSAFDSLAAAAVLVAFGPAHFNINYGLVASSSIFFNLVTPLGMKGLVVFLGWPWLFLSVGFCNFIALLLTLYYTSE
ncbi:major facilitator superfamily MFS-1 domain containing protein [Elysia marginata]|uniref:Major facilitator superfamily MFS-1 domain containing protein n=1 Tax=Elysia marginata TaxID=1093978 RepID=A0AAV4JD41_9GAST|nr:major facilitator superfamily MFS-1 domain containing protein [Elysia marginata]